MPNQTGGDFCGGLPPTEKALLESRHSAANANAQTFGSSLVIDPEAAGGHLGDGRHFAHSTVPDPEALISGLHLAKK